MPSRRKQLFHADLLPFLAGEGVRRELRHPLIARPVPDDLAADVINRMYAEKKRRLENARRTNNWTEYVWIHERDFRPAALRKVVSRLTDDAYWRLVSQVWIDATSIHQNLEDWIALWKSQRFMREPTVMADHHLLRDQIEIHRGTAQHLDWNGLSWSTSITVANNFATTASQTNPVVVTAVVAKNAVRAWFRTRSEIVVLPDTYRITRTKSYRIGSAETRPPNAVGAVV